MKEPKKHVKKKKNRQKKIEETRSSKLPAIVNILRARWYYSYIVEPQVIVESKA